MRKFICSLFGHKLRKSSTWRDRKTDLWRCVRCQAYASIQIKGEKPRSGKATRDGEGK